jgi:hypothetical protein
MRFFLLIFVLITFNASFAHGKWELEKNANGVKVYTRDNDNSDIKEFKAVATVFADRFEIARCVSRVGDYPNWVPNTKDCRVVEVISPQKRKVYSRLDIPWPATDRDGYMIMRVETIKEKKQTTVYFDDCPGKKNSDCVRMASANGFWRMTTLDKNKTEVVYQFVSDPAGSLPSWIVNMFIVDGPYDTMIALKKKLE